MCVCVCVCVLGDVQTNIIKAVVVVVVPVFILFSLLVGDNGGGAQLTQTSRV